MSVAGDNGNRMDIILRLSFMLNLRSPGFLSRVDFTVPSGRVVSRNVLVTGRTGSTIHTSAGDVHIKEIQGITREP